MNHIMMPAMSRRLKLQARLPMLQIYNCQHNLTGLAQGKPRRTLLKYRLTTNEYSVGIPVRSPNKCFIVQSLLLSS